MTIKLNGSTAGSVALDAPASTTGNADISFKLPVADGSAGQVLKTDGSSNLGWVSTGLSEVDMWRITTSANSNNSTTIMTSNWARSNATGFSKVGTGMSESSGIFTFPSTGIYRLEFNSLATVAGGTSSSAAFAYIEATTNNSSYSEIIGSASSIGDAGGGGTLYYANFNVATYLDVTDTSNVKVRFKLYSDGNVTWRGYTGYPSTYAVFTKVAET
tara:strand:+ start:3106 stop:3753 length:648 start_codon:yes stop_codon:yes gene_type:complete